MDSSTPQDVALAVPTPLPIADLLAECAAADAANAPMYFGLCDDGRIVFHTKGATCLLQPEQARLYALMMRAQDAGAGNEVSEAAARLEQLALAQEAAQGEA